MQKFIEFVLRGKNLLSGETDEAAGSIDQLKTEIKELDKELKQVEQTQANIDTFNALSEEAKQLEQALEQTQQELSKFSSEQAKASAKVEAASNSYKELSTNAKALDTTYKNQTQSLTKNNTSLERATIKMREQGSVIKATEQAINNTNKSYGEQQQKLKALEAEYKSSKKPVDDLNNSYSVAKAQLTALEQIQKRQAAELEKSKTAYTQSANEVERLTTSQASFKEAIETTKTALSNANTELSKFEQEQKDSNEQLKTATRNYTATSKAVSKFSSDLTKTNATLAKVGSNLKSSGVDTKKLADATTTLAAKQKQLTTSIKQSFGALATMTKNLKGVRGAMERTKQSVGGLTTQLAAMAGTYFGIRGLTNQLVDFVKVGSSFEIFRKQFEGIMGSVTQGEVAFQWVRDFAKKTPLDMEQATQAFVLLKGSGLDPMQGSFEALVDSTAKYTGGTAKLENITRQLSQAYAKGRITAEDMNNAQDNGLPVWNLLAQATGKTVGELRNLSEQGKLGQYHMRLLFDEMGRDSLGSSAKLMGTFSGQLAVVTDNIKIFKDTIAQSGALDALTSKLTSLNAEIAEMSADGRLKAYAQELSDSFVKMVNGTSASIKSLFTNLDGFATKTKQTFAAFSIGANAVTIGLKAILSSFSAVIKIVANFQSNILSAFGLIPNAASEAAKEVANFFQAMEDEATKQMNEDISKLNVALDVFKDKASESGDSASKLAKDVGEISLAIEPLGGLLNLTAEQALSMAQGLVAAGDSITTLDVPVDRLKETISLLIAKFKEDPSADVQAMVARLTGIYDSLGASVGKQSNTIVKSLQDIEQEFRNTGGESLEQLQENVNKTAEVFQRFSEAKKPVSELRQAFLQQLDAQLELAKAQDNYVLPSNLALQASVLGLTDEYKLANTELDQHNAKMSGLAEVAEYLTQRQDKLNKATQLTTDTTKKQAQAQEALNKSNAAAESHAGANVAFQKLWNEAKERSIQLYDLAALSVEQLSARVGELGSQLSNAFKDQSWSNILKPINDLNNAAKRNELVAIEQEKAYRKLFAQMENGSLSVEQLDHYARNASESFDQLSKTRLDALQNQINTAKNAARELKNELNDTLTDLQNELDQLEGNQQAVIRRNYEADKKELEVKLEQARKSGDNQAIADAREALAIQKEIFNLKTAEAKTETINTTKKITENNNTNTNVKQSVQVQELRYTVIFKAANATSTFTGGGKEVENFLKQLQDQGLTVTRG